MSLPALTGRLARGWNTWNTRSVLSHVLLPEAFALNLGLFEYTAAKYLREALIGRIPVPGVASTADEFQPVEVIHPAPRTLWGEYTDLTLRWMGIEMRVESAAVGDDLLLLITPAHQHLHRPLLVVEAGILWSRKGSVCREGERLIAHCGEREIVVYATTAHVDDPLFPAIGPYLALPLDTPIGIATGVQRTVAEIRALLDDARAHLRAMPGMANDDLSDITDALTTCLAWDTVYDPLHDRVLSPVSRVWNCRNGGYILFEWDTYFAAYLAAPCSRDLAYANLFAITQEMTEEGFVPNASSAFGLKTRGSSEPPVGALITWKLYQRFGDRWVLESLFDDLLGWNRWWTVHRDLDGYLCWGSDPFTPRLGNHLETWSVNELQGAKFESGLDNSPMFDDVPYDAERHLLLQADVGLMSLYIADCEALRAIALELERELEADELGARAAHYRAMLATLWDDASGLYLNKRLDNGELSHRLSPTMFYPMLAGVPTPEQAARMVNEHLLNPAEFWGEWVIPSIPRNDTAYREQNYWRGRIWAPMNFLVYLGLCRYDLPQARRTLAEKSQALLLQEWRAHGHICENYNADTGIGADVPNADPFYHWGALLGIIALEERKGG